MRLYFIKAIFQISGNYDLFNVIEKLSHHIDCSTWNNPFYLLSMYRKLLKYILNTPNVPRGTIQTDRNKYSICSTWNNHKTQYHNGYEGQDTSKTLSTP